MAAYLISHGTPRDASKLQEYVALSGPILESYGGIRLAVGRVTGVVTGSHRHVRAAIFRFPDLDACNRCFESPEYKALESLRNEACDFDFIVMEEA